MAAQTNRQFRLKQRRVGRAKSTDFDFAEARVPTAKASEAVIQTLYLSIDPTNRIWMSDIEQYMPPVAIGEVMRGGGIGRVVAPNSGRWQVGDLVGGLLGWQDYCLASEGDMFAPRKLPKDLPVPLPAMLAPRASPPISGSSIFANRSRARRSWFRRLPGRSALLRAKSRRSRAAVPWVSLEDPRNAVG